MIEIPAGEFAERRERVRAAAEDAGLAGLLVCSRGGGTTDRYGDVKYLTNFYTRFPFIPDVPGEWTARAHAFVLLPAEGEPVLVADDKPKRDEEMAIEYLDAALGVFSQNRTDEVVPQIARTIFSKGNVLFDSSDFQGAMEAF